jgi:hypothetical protein
MSQKTNNSDSAHEGATIELKLPVPERDIIVTSRHADDALQGRVRKTPAGQVISFSIEELEDLHRGLAFEANETHDKKRAKTIGKVLRKIEDLIDEDDGDELTELQSAVAGFSFADWPGRTPAMRGKNPPTDLPFSAAQCRVVLTKAQRELICSMDTVSLDLHKMLAVDSAKECEFEWNPRQAMVVTLAMMEALEQCPNEKAALPYAEIMERVNSGVAEAEALSELDEDEMGSALDYDESQTEPLIAFQLKITLEGSKPPIWRQVAVGDCTLDVLHQIIQLAMGWTDSHMHMFAHGNERFSHPRFELEGDEYDETEVWLSDLVEEGCKKLRYCYDFGDDWEHTIAIEKQLRPKAADKFPRCIKGSGACPPEDCGGIWGYYEMIDAIRDPKHERHEELVEWLPVGFDPERFDLKETNELLSAGPGGGFEEE